ncbi:hypothetical protein [Reichenbachiella sp. MALMAid0571]|uniref:hypothetical protein n=1 Tax=Reichenbachiella sp. MALMAid0571 TaxID=3143939 RepID=UPI0032DE5014
MELITGTVKVLNFIKWNLNLSVFDLSDKFLKEINKTHPNNLSVSLHFDHKKAAQYFKRLSMVFLLLI